MKNLVKIFGLGLAMAVGVSAFAGGHMMSVAASDQDVSEGSVIATEVKSEADGWLVVHRTDASGKPGPVIGHAPLKEGVNSDVVVPLSEKVQSGERLMLMLHGEAGGQIAGEFEYTLGAKEDGPVKKHGELVVVVITAN